MNVWALDGRYKEFIKSAWNNTREDLGLVLENTRCKSLEFNKDIFGDNKKRKKGLEKRIIDIQSSCNWPLLMPSSIWKYLSERS